MPAPSDPRRNANQRPWQQRRLWLSPVYPWRRASIIGSSAALRRSAAAVGRRQWQSTGEVPSWASGPMVAVPRVRNCPHVPQPNGVRYSVVASSQGATRSAWCAGML